MDIKIKFTALHKGVEASVEWNLSKKSVTIDGRYDFDQRKAYNLPVMNISKTYENRLKKHNLELKCFGKQRRIVGVPVVGFNE